MVLPEPEIADNGFSLDPPLAGIVIRYPIRVRRDEPLITHGTVREKAFIAGKAHGVSPGTDALHYGLVLKGEGAFQSQPGSLNVMSVGNTARKHAPVTFKVKLQMPGLIHNLGADDVQKSLNSLLQAGIGPYGIKIRISFKDMKMRVHGLIGIYVVGRQ